MAGDYALITGPDLAFDRNGAARETTAAVGDIRSVSTGNGKQAQVMDWGRDNCLPMHREALVAGNNIVGTLMRTRRNIVLGRGLMAYTETIVDGEQVITEVSMPEAAAEFFEESEIEKYFATAARNDIFHAAIPTEYIRGKGSQVNRIRALECRHFRLGEQDDRGRIRHGYWRGNWGREKKRASPQPAQQIPMYDRSKVQAKFCTFEVDDLLCLDEYYPSPDWWGGEEWIRLANKIPQFHDANLAHGYSMRWHIKVPKGYFLNRNAYDSATTEDERNGIIGKANAARAEFVRRLNDTLQGLKNAGKTIITEFDVNQSMNQSYPGIEITPLSYDMKDEALLKLFEASNAANMSAQGIHPTLANIQTQGKLSSGSEIRNAYLMYVAIHAPQARERLLRPVKLVKRLNGWPPEVHYGFRDMLITRLDEDKSGSRTSTETPSA